MKCILFLAVLLNCFFYLGAQKIKYESSFEKAKNIALQQHKPVAVLITIRPPASAIHFMKGLEDKAVVEKFNNDFINYTADREDTAASRSIIAYYNIYRFPSFIFLDSRGGLLFSDIAFVSMPASLLDIADKAIAATKGKSLVDYDSAYTAGASDARFLKEYILKRKAAGIADNANLIEKYVNGINVTDLNSYAEVLFILKAGPVADSNAYKLAYLNRHITDSIFKAEPLADRIAMNNATIQNTMASAIANKNISRAVAGAEFTRKSWASNYSEGQKNWYLKMLQYYGGVKDTANYLKNAVLFYDQYYMGISVDSIRRKDSLDYEVAKNRARQNAQVVPGDTIRRTFSFAFPKNSIAGDLNNAAWYFYLAAGNNDDYLLKAMLWSRRSIELSQGAAFYDTYAHLLYRLKFYEEAESMENKAVELGKTEKAETKTFQEEYKKIKNKTL